MAQTLPNGVVIPEQTESISGAGVQELRTVGQTADASLAGKASTGYVDNGLNDAKKFASQKYDESISYASAVESASLVRDADLEALIAGMEGMDYVGAWEPGYVYRINDVVTHGGDSWARLTAGSTGEPGADPAAWGLVARKGDGGGFGELSETDVTGLYETVEPEPSVPVSWADLIGKPATYPSTIPEVDGLQAIIDRLTVGTGSVTITTGVEGIDGGSIAVQRFGPIVYMNILSLQLNAETGDLIGVVPAWARPPATIDLTIAQPSPSFAAGPVRIYSNGNIRFYNRTGSYIAGLVSYPTAHPYPDL